MQQAEHAPPRLCDLSSLIMWKSNYPVVWCIHTYIANFLVFFFCKIWHVFSKNWHSGPQNSNSCGQNLSGDKSWCKSDKILMEFKLQTSLKLHKGSLIKLKTSDQTTGSHRLLSWAHGKFHRPRVLLLCKKWPGKPLIPCNHRPKPAINLFSVSLAL